MDYESTAAAKLVRVVGLHHPLIIEQLKWSGFRRMSTEIQLLHDGDALLHHARAKRPDLIVLAAVSDDNDVYALCKQLKDIPSLADVPVILYCRSAPQPTRELIRDLRCSEFLVGQLSRGELYETIAPYLHLATRAGARVRVTARVIFANGQDPLRGEIFDLSQSGARVIMNRQPPESVVQAGFRSESHPEVSVSAQVVWSTQRGELFEVALKFLEPTDEAAERIRRMTSWEISQGNGDESQRIHLLRGLTAETTFDGLIEQLAGSVDFDLQDVNSITSQGIGTWINFLRKIPAQTSYRLLRCSKVFCLQASYVPEALGRCSEIVSTYAPYYSAEHDFEMDCEVMVADLGDEFPFVPPDLPCPLGGMMSFDDLPERFFQFLAEPRQRERITMPRPAYIATPDPDIAVTGVDGDGP